MYSYKLLRSEPNILVSRLLYHRIPVEHVGHRLDPPQDIAGRRLFVFEKAEGEKDIWWELKADEQVRAYFIHVTRSFQLLALIFSLGLSSCSGSPHACIAVQIRSPAPLCRVLAS